jgi:hypothetical protein
MDIFASARSIASNNKIDPTRIEIIQQWRIGLTSKCKIKDIKRGEFAYKLLFQTNIGILSNGWRTIESLWFISK